MYLRVINEKGAMTVFNLDRLPLWRIELASFKEELGIGIRYFTGTEIHLGMIAALDTHAPHENPGVATKGLPFKEREKTLDVFQEHVKVLYNSNDLKAKDKDEVITKALGLLDVYHKILDALRTGANLYMEYETYRFCITKEATGYEEF